MIAKSLTPPSSASSSATGDSTSTHRLPRARHDAKVALEALFRALDRNADGEELVTHGEYLISLGTKADT